MGTLARKLMNNAGNILFVGAVSGNSLSSTITLDLTALTGGIDTAARDGDVVIFAHLNRNTSAGDLDVGTTTSGYTEIADIYDSDTAVHVNLSVNWKRMGSTPDTQVISNNTTSRNVAIAYVLRGVDPSTPLDVTSTTATGQNSGRADPPSIAPTTVGSVVLAIGANISSSTAALTGPSGYSNIVNRADNTTTPYPVIGIGMKYWTSGAEDPAAWTGTGDSTTYAWTAVTLALRPA